MIEISQFPRPGCSEFNRSINDSHRERLTHTHEHGEAGENFDQSLHEKTEPPDIPQDLGDHVCFVIENYGTPIATSALNVNGQNMNTNTMPNLVGDVT